MLNLKKQKEKIIEEKITSSISQDLFTIFINSNNFLDFKLKIEKQKYKNPEKIWKIFYPKYDKYRIENLEKLKLNK